MRNEESRTRTIVPDMDQRLKCQGAVHKALKVGSRGTGAVNQHSMSITTSRKNDIKRFAGNRWIQAARNRSKGKSLPKTKMCPALGALW
ncbi:jg17341 [Pararge aegeria aegeria]|uniref:Jg17341 protein n=1 Tax=Pararge aegeria aegeria TaxID=348720 RepID=A0A8S4SN34_9NEOP|nr:jg17341 [Pararge aegeria aegeria]